MIKIFDIQPKSKFNIILVCHEHLRMSQIPDNFFDAIIYYRDGRDVNYLETQMSNNIFVFYHYVPLYFQAHSNLYLFCYGPTGAENQKYKILTKLPDDRNLLMK